MKNRLRKELEAMLGLHTGDSFTADNVHTLVNGIFAADEGGGFEYVEYDNNAFPYPQTIGNTASSIVGLGNADESMIDTIFIMPNKETDSTATLMIVVDEVDPSTDPKTYQYVYVGNINDLPSDVLTEGSIVNDLTSGGTDKPLSAEQGRTLNSHVNYTTCGSGAADQVKLISDDGFELSTNLRLLVKMNNTNTNAIPKFNINNTGVKDVWYNGSVASDINTWSAGEVLDVYYDGIKYIANTHGGAQFSTGEKVGDVGIDDEPIAGSENLVKSGGVKNAIQNAKNRQYFASYSQDKNFWDDVFTINGILTQEGTYDTSYANTKTLKFDISNYTGIKLYCLYSGAFHNYLPQTGGFAVFGVENDGNITTFTSVTASDFEQEDHYKPVKFTYTPISGDTHLYISVTVGGIVSVVCSEDDKPAWILYPEFKDIKFDKRNVTNNLGNAEDYVVSQKTVTKKVQSINLLNTNDPDCLIDYYIDTTGTSVYSQGSFVSGYIPFKKEDKLRFTKISTSQVTWPNSIQSLWDKNKNFIATINANGQSDLITTYENCAYIRVLAHISYVYDDLVISYDTNATEYIPYYDLHTVHNSVPEVVQSLGNSTTKVISQKGVNDSLSEVNSNKDIDNASLDNILSPIATYAGSYITSSGYTYATQNTKNFKLVEYDVSSINDGTKYIYIYGHGFIDYNPSTYALGRFTGSLTTVIPQVNAELLNRYKVLVPSGATELQIAIKDEGVLKVIYNTIDELVPISLYSEDDRMKAIIEEPIEITWTNNTYYTDYYSGGNPIGQTVTTASDSHYRASKINVESYRGKVIGLQCICGANYNKYVDSLLATDQNKVSRVGFDMQPSTPLRLIYIPSSVSYLCITNHKDYPDVRVGVVNIVSLQNMWMKIENNTSDLQQQIDIKNQWKGKKILWLGTSIPWGQSDEDYPGTTHRVDHPYPQQVCSALGATLIDSTHGGLAQMAAYDSDSGKWYPKPYTAGGTTSGGSTCLTIAECQAAYSAGLISSDLSDYSYENTLLGKNADLYVFDVEPNNNDTGSADDLALFDWRLWKYTDNSTFASHRNTYIGALIYEIDQLLTEKPNAVIVFVGEFYVMNTAGSYNDPYPVRIQSKALCEKFHIGYINLANKLFYVGKNASQWINSDNTHPKQAAYDRMAKMLINELLLIA